MNIQHSTFNIEQPAVLGGAALFNVGRWTLNVERSRQF